MANRLIFSKIVSKHPLLKPLLIKANADLIRSRAHSQIKPSVPLLSKPSLFSVQVIKKYYELLPLFIITGAAVVGLTFAVVRSALTRDDVRFSTKSKMLCEKPEYNGPRKFLVFNQKYEPPKAWYEAMEALKEPTAEEETKKK